MAQKLVGMSFPCWYIDNRKPRHLNDAGVLLSQRIVTAVFAKASYLLG